jgi:hypothetical protein
MHLSFSKTSPILLLTRSTLVDNIVTKLNIFLSQKCHEIVPKTEH